MGLWDKKKYAYPARTIAFVGIAAATVECAKLALSFLPNVEVVTLLVALYGYVFGWIGVCAAAVFVCIEPLIYGINTWVITYFIYWPLVALVFMLLRRAKLRNRWIITAAAALLTVIFGILSSVVDTALMLGVNEYYFKNLLIYYARGIVFYAVQIVSNAVLFPLLFTFLADKLKMIKRNMKI